MASLCRLCASLRKVNVLTAVKDNSSEICDKIRKCCHLDIKMEDSLPKSICQECIINLNDSHKFYTKVQEAQETLAALYPSQDNKTANISMQQTSSAHEETLIKNVTTAIKQHATCTIVEANKSIVEISDNQSIVLEKQLLANKFCTEDSKEVEQIEPTTGICLKSISEDSCQNLEPIYCPNEDAEEMKSPVNSGNDQIHLADGEDQTLTNNDVQYDLVAAEGEESQSDTVIQQINLLSDSEIDVEIEYMGYLEEEEEEEEENENYIDINKDIGEACDDKGNTVHDSVFSAEIRIRSWKNYKHLCFICDTIFNSYHNLKSHAAQQHNIKQVDSLKYKCYDCRKIITRYNSFLNHVRARHHPDLKLKCDACDLSCQDFAELTQHRSLNCTAAKAYVHTTGCEYCFKSFNNTNGLQNHIKFQHIPSAKAVYKCKQCDKEFQYKSCVRVHERLHSDIKQFSCDYCDKSFHTKVSLEQHLYVHVEEKAFRCLLCNRSYKTSKSLDYHRKLHAAEKPFKCQFCSKAFSRKIQKITHERSHTGEMPYSCDQCNKKFRYRSALFVHEKIHTGRKPYTCDYCKKTFADSSNRNKHVRRMHPKDKMLDNKSLL